MKPNHNLTRVHDLDKHRKSKNLAGIFRSLLPSPPSAVAGVLAGAASRPTTAVHPWPSHPSFVGGGLQSLPSTGEPSTSLQLVHSVNGGPVNLKAHFCGSGESPDLLF